MTEAMPDAAILTWTGRVVRPFAADPGEIVIADIARALSRLCRFGGHCSQYYSVAEHSMLVSTLLQERGACAGLQLEGLLHDAPEAYLGDVVSPLKGALRLMPIAGGVSIPFAEVEEWLAHRVRVAVGAPIKPEHADAWAAAIRDADRLALAIERRDLMPASPPWPSLEGVDPNGSSRRVIVAMSPDEAMNAFLARYIELIEPALRAALPTGAAT